eukprot:TRINITY_DN1433_c0_g5_i1.p2 TRINITY_DN1433_c0_g5~~TRINITY_DN1433_c0_g5_i1.p2  ORF type:complete len:299 (+),score=25.14 TRINITY_DN1433_c0_g5_i1:34-897(+)
MSTLKWWRVRPCRLLQCKLTNKRQIGSRDRVSIICSSEQKKNKQNESAGDLITEYKYNSSDGHAKATLEQIFGPVMQRLASEQQQSEDSLKEKDDSPWTLSWQMSERNMAWSDELKVSIIKNSTANNLGLTEEQVEDRLQSLSFLIPEIQSKLSVMKVDTLTAFLANPNRVAARLVRLKRIFPTANVGEMMLRRYSLGLNEDLNIIENGVEELRELLPNVSIDYLAQENPVILNFESFKAALNDAKRMMPKVDIQQILLKNPGVVLSMQKGTDMIPYDPVPGLDEKI